VRPTQAGRPSTSPLAAWVGWLVVLAALFVVVEYWRWVVAGLVVLLATAALGLLLEWVQLRRQTGRAVRPG
jgi:hypothetical protein